MIWQSINVEHDCHYCVPAHTGIAKGMKVDDAITEALVKRNALPNGRLEALRSFTLSVVRKRGKVDERAVQDFSTQASRAARFSKWCSASRRK